MEPDLNAIVRHMTDIIPSQCGCRGGGWILTDYDTRHECPLHYRGQPNPEYEYEIDDKVWDEVRLELDREAYVRIRGDAVDDLVAMGMTVEEAEEKFLTVLRDRVPRPPKPEDWVQNAYTVAAELRERRHNRDNPHHY